MEKALVKIIFAVNFFIYQPIFKFFVLLFKAFGMQKDDKITFNYFLLDVFQNKVMCRHGVIKKIIVINCNLITFSKIIECNCN